MKHLEKNKVDVERPKKFIKNNTLISKSQERFKDERHYVFIEEINKIALSSNNDEIIQSIGLIDWIICKKVTNKM